MARVVSQGNISIYVYKETGGRHHLPHCHVYWNNREESAQLALPSLRVLAGSNPPAAARELARENLDAIWAAWDALNTP